MIESDLENLIALFKCHVWPLVKEKDMDLNKFTFQYERVLFDEDYVEVMYPPKDESPRSYIENCVGKIKTYTEDGKVYFYFEPHLSRDKWMVPEVYTGMKRPPKTPDVEILPSELKNFRP
jgi:hypothetical protein